MELLGPLYALYGYLKVTLHPFLGDNTKYEYQKHRDYRTR